MNSSLLTKDIDWFCHHAVNEGIINSATCVAVFEAIESSGNNPTLEIFVQVIVDNQICSDIERLQQIADMAVQEAQTLGFPPKSVFDAPAATMAPDIVADPSQTDNGGDADDDNANLGQRPAVTLRDPLPPSADPWLNDWPLLAEAEECSREAAVDILNAFLQRARQEHCSDVHIATGAFPFVRRYKTIYRLTGQQIVTAKVAANLNLSPLNDEQRREFEQKLDMDYSYNVSETNRYRTNLIYQRLGCAGSYRVIDEKVPTIHQLGFKNPEIIEKLTTYNQGLILVTGPACCGKSTTLNALVDYINKKRHDHIITIEDPIEIVHRSIGCNVTQRELNRHTRNFHNALRAMLREDPDVIVIGELRDLETIEMAIHASETGHLVFGTLHTSSAPATMDRVLDVFPVNQQSQIRSMVAESLKGVICQQLWPNANLNGVVMAAEIMLNTLAVSNLIRDGKTFQISSTIQTSRNIGMSTMEQSHFDLYMDGKRSYEQTDPFVKAADLKRQMQVHEAKKFSAASGKK